MQGKIVKAIAGFYYVNVAESGIYECRARGIFRKKNLKPLVGDLAHIFTTFCKQESRTSYQEWAGIDS